MPDDGRAGLDVYLTLARPTRGASSDRFSLDVAFGAPPGFTLIFGPSGAGKSTILSAIAGFVRPTSGRITLGNETWFDAERGIDVAPQNRSVALVFQTLALFPHMTAAQNVAYGMARSTDRAARGLLVTALLERLRVPHLASRKPPTFSGGEAQRVAVARALATRPRVVLLDEPFSALDPKLRRDLTADVRATLRELNVPVLIVTHQPNEIAEAGDQLVCVEGGRIARGDSIAIAASSTDESRTPA
jgi:molybdate transport system ATP-binding protein